MSIQKPTESKKQGGNCVAQLRAKYDTGTAERRAKQEARAKRAARDAKRMAGEKVGSGRPPALLPTADTLKQIEGLGMLDCTYEEVAAFLGVSRETIEQFLGTHIKAREALENGKGKGRISLRRAQRRLAEKNAAMAIWLGKQRLGQKDVVEVTNEDGPNKAAASADARSRALELLERLGLGSASEAFGRGAAATRPVKLPGVPDPDET